MIHAYTMGDNKSDSSAMSHFYPNQINTEYKTKNTFTIVIHDKPEPQIVENGQTEALDHSYTFSLPVYTSHMITPPEKLKKRSKDYHPWDLIF